MVAGRQPDLVSIDDRMQYSYSVERDMLLPKARSIRVNGERDASS